MVQLPDIAKPCGVTPAGFLSVYVVRTGHVQTMPSARNGIIIGDIVLFPPMQWAFWGFIAETVSFAETDKLTDFGQMFMQTATLDIREDRASTVAVLNDLIMGEFVVLLMNALGKVRVIGHPDLPARLSSPAQVDAKGGAFNGYKFTFTALSASRAPFYEGEIYGYVPLTFMIDGFGHLLYEGAFTPGTTAALSVAGHLQISGLNEADYSLNTANGHAEYL